MWFVLFVIVWEIAPSIANWIDAKAEETRARAKHIKKENE